MILNNILYLTKTVWFTYDDSLNVVIVFLNVMTTDGVDMFDYWTYARS